MVCDVIELVADGGPDNFAYLRNWRVLPDGHTVALYARNTCEFDFGTVVIRFDGEVFDYSEVGDGCGFDGCWAIVIADATDK